MSEVPYFRLKQLVHSQIWLNITIKGKNKRNKILLKKSAILQEKQHF